ncbi:2'-5' RNA ligase family protein [Niabella sp. CC-SYL272]|nr:2'-5' RNA ligase family protein [Niabella agricola]MCF3108001.1 2'-5' RNA ligase family protein [Niabella agricola]
MKQQLRSAIGWYGSVNAQAHITFNVFQAGAAELKLWERYTTGFAAQQQPLPLLFDHTGAFANGAFFLAPDVVSEPLLIRMMQAFHHQAPMPASISVKPHMSIGRRLSPLQLIAAQQLIPEVGIRFVCTGLVLRRFNNTRKQYDIIRHFPFTDAAAL